MAMVSLERRATRETITTVINSRLWNDFVPRDGDVVVAAYPKCGTTWMQRIVDLLIFQSSEPRPLMQIAPWLDCVFLPHEANLAVLEAQAHRRSVKSHLPFDSLPIFKSVQYIHMARDGRDACLSKQNHEIGEANQIIAAVAAGDLPAETKTPPIAKDPREYFLKWMAENEAGVGKPDAGLPFFEFEQTYWTERGRPNLLLVHYADLKADLAGEMARIAGFLEIKTPAAVMDQLVNSARFETMRGQGEALLPEIGQHFDQGARRFLNQGQNGRWIGSLTEDDVSRYGALAAAKLSFGLNAWLHGGRRGGDPRQAAD